MSPGILNNAHPCRAQARFGVNARALTAPLPCCQMAALHSTPEGAEDRGFHIGVELAGSAVLRTPIQAAKRTLGMPSPIFGVPRPEQQPVVTFRRRRQERLESLRSDHW